jgi:hypothetical protein
MLSRYQPSTATSSSLRGSALGKRKPGALEPGSPALSFGFRGYHYAGYPSKTRREWSNGVSASIPFIPMPILSRSTFHALTPEEHEAVKTKASIDALGVGGTRKNFIAFSYGGRRMAERAACAAAKPARKPGLGSGLGTNLPGPFLSSFTNSYLSAPSGVGLVVVVRHAG